MIINCEKNKYEKIRKIYENVKNKKKIMTFLIYILFFYSSSLIKNTHIHHKNGSAI